MSHAHANEFVTATGVRWDDPEEGKTWLVSLISIIVLAALVVFLSVVFFQSDIGYTQENVVADSHLALQKRVAEQKELLLKSGPHTMKVGDKEVKRQWIPVAEAMKQIVANPRLAVPPAARTP